IMYLPPPSQPNFGKSNLGTIQSESAIFCNASCPEPLSCLRSQCTRWSRYTRFLVRHGTSTKHEKPYATQCGHPTTALRLPPTQDASGVASLREPKEFRKSMVWCTCVCIHMHCHIPGQTRIS
ncbi:hypothetical protein Hypma_005539, partial [Hypsizygus marmoreus]